MALQQAERVLRTQGKPKPFEYWNDVVCQSFTALVTDPMSPQQFEGEIHHRRGFQDGSLSTIKASPQIVRRTKSGIAHRPSNAYFLNVQIEGHSAVSHNGTETLLGPGDTIVLDADAPFEMRFHDKFRQTCLHLNAEGLPDPSFLAGTFLRSGSRLAQSTATTLQDIAQGCDTVLFTDAVKALLVSASRTTQRTALSRQHLACIKHYVAQHSDDPDLSPETLAQHFGISKRHVHNLFATNGETFGQYLLYRRVRRAQSRMLSAPHELFLHIAHQSGFKTASHFSRSFKRYFGMSPQTWYSFHRNG